MGLTSQYCQRNEIHKDKPLGTAQGSTIGKYGCLLCSVSRMLYYLLDEDFPPVLLNRMLVDASGYANGNLLKWESLAEAVSGIEFVERVDYSNKLFTDGDAAYYEGLFATGEYGILVKVDSNLVSPGVQDHWLYLEYVMPLPWCSPYNGWYCFDPWFGTTIEIGSYYSPYGRKLDYSVWAIAVYRRNTSPLGIGGC